MLPNRKLKTAAALALALGTITPATATAKPVGPDLGTSPTTQTPPTQIVHVTTPTSFDWGDAGIGAAGGLAISMLGLGSALVITSQRRTRHP
jgi:hypothetical protein